MIILTLIYECLVEAQHLAICSILNCSFWLCGLVFKSLSPAWTSVAIHTNFITLFSGMKVRAYLCFLVTDFCLKPSIQG